MIPFLVEENKIRGINTWVTTTKYVGASFESNLLDLESEGIDHKSLSLEQVLKNIPTDIEVKIELQSQWSNEQSGLHPRSIPLSKIGYKKIRNIYHFQRQLKNIIKNSLKDDLVNRHIERETNKLIEEIPVLSFKSCGIHLKNIENINPFIPSKLDPIIQTPMGFFNGEKFVGVLKLINPPTNDISTETLASLFGYLPNQARIVVNLKRIPNEASKLRFNSVLKSLKSSFLSQDIKKTVSAEEAIENISNGDSFLLYEFHVIVESESENELRERLIETKINLQNYLGDFSLDVEGSWPSFVSSLPGSRFHFSDFFEAIPNTQRDIKGFLPIYSYGSGERKTFEEDSFVFHRLDGSIDSFDLFDKNSPNYCLNIIGQSGLGKSTLINRLIKCLAQNPHTQIIIVDVKGSYTRIIEQLGGEIHKISYQDNSGIDPVTFLNNLNDNNTISIIKTFISELLLEDDEYKLPEVISSELEPLLIEFSKSDKEKTLKSLIDFLPQGFYRLSMLKRYTEGLSQNIFSKNTNTNRNRIRYYNFQDTASASNTTLSRAIMASVMADFNFSLLSKKKSEKLVFMNDENKFFSNCFTSFDLLSKNVRALHGSLILSAQQSDVLIVDGNKDLISNASHHILFSAEGSPEKYAETMNIPLNIVEKLFHFPSEIRKGSFSQFLISNFEGNKTGQLYLTDQEYWESTTEAPDLARMERIKEVIPDISTEDMIYLANNYLKRKSE